MIYRLQGEKSVLGCYFSGHPLQAFEQELTTLGRIPIGQLENYQVKTGVVCAGALAAVNGFFTPKKALKWRWSAIEDKTGRIEVTLFSNFLIRLRLILAN